MKRLISSIAVKLYWLPLRLIPAALLDWMRTTDYQLQRHDDELDRLRARVEELEKALDYLSERDLAR